MILQRTISSSVQAYGVGLHSGERIFFRLRPADPNTGIIFVRRDLDNLEIRCDPFKVNDTRLSSTIVVNDGVRVATIEHLMSALAGFGIDNLIVEMDAQETPIFDGSAACFLYLLSEAEIREQAAKKRYIRILREVKVRDQNKFAKLLPFNGFKMRLDISFDNMVIRNSSQTLEIDFKDQCYSEEISRARTFGFVREIEVMRKMNLGLGGNIDNAIIVDEDRILNPQRLRYKDEFVRHKLLDVIGDLYIVGYPLIGQFVAYRTGHFLNNQLLRALLSDDENYEFVEFDNLRDVPSSFHKIPFFNPN